MVTTVHGHPAHFTQHGQGRDVVLLHGWGASGDSFAPVTHHLARRLRVTVPDLPGFGKTPPPENPWGSSEYAQFVLAFLDALEISRSHIVAHSFGGRIAIQIAAAHPERVGSLVLVASAGIRPRRTIKQRMKIGAYKAIRSLARGRAGRRLVERFATRMGSKDYGAATGALRGTLVRVVNEDLRHLLPSISAPTLLIWGSEDSATPVRDAELMERLIPDARLIVFPGAGHYSHLDRLPQFLRNVDAFLNPPLHETAGGIG